MSHAADTQTKQWHTQVPGGVAYLRVRLDGSVEYLHARTGDWIDLAEIEADMDATTNTKIRGTARRMMRDLEASRRREDLQALRGREFIIETNSGTYGAAEAHRAIGVSDPEFADYRIYETVGGERRSEGCDPRGAPGRARSINKKHLADARKRLRELESQS